MPICPKCRHQSSEIGGKCPYDEYYFVPDDAINDARRDPMIGTIIADKYIVIASINEGGMGAVYRALQMPIQREVALKVLRAELRESEQGGERFIREARAVARLQHPNIIHLHDFGFDEIKHPYMVMEYAPGDSLDSWLRTQKLTYERIIHVVRQVLSALHEAHERGIVHRDLKPENIIIVRSGTDYDFVKLLDFGIARVINEGATQSLTREGEVFGTPHYMAPEQARGEKNIGPPADVYAVGIMLFEMLSGRQPFDAPTPLSVLFQHINDPLPPLVARPGITIPDSISEILEIATAKDIDQRYQTAAEFLHALDHAAPNTNVSSVRDAATLDLSNSNISPPRAQALPAQELGRTAMTTPAGVPSDVPFYDPDPSMERPTVTYETFEGSQRKRPVVLIVGGGAMLVVLMFMALYGWNRETPQGADATVKTAENVENKLTNAPVENPPTPNINPTTPTLPATDQVEQPAVDVEKVDKPVPETPDEQVTDESPIATKQAVSETKPTRKTPKKATKKTVSTTPTHVEEKSETTTPLKKLPEPVKFAPVDNRKW